MRRFVFSFALLTVLIISAAHAKDRIGFREITVPDQRRPLAVVLWYSTKDRGPETTVAENMAFHGVSAIRNATVMAGPHPLVLLSHGFGGNWRNQSWLAAELARRGYMVATLDHPGTTSFDRDPATAARLWERPRDISRVIDTLLADPKLNIADKQIAAIGHSLGGWTVAELAGARFDAALVTRDCEERFGHMECKLFAELGIGRDAASIEKLAGDLSDQRIGAVVTLDLGLARGFTPDNLAALRTPFLVIAAGSDIGREEAVKAAVAATNKDSRYLVEHLPKATTTYAEIADALHFSFLQICKPGAIDLIEEDAPGEGIVCKDGGARKREAIHREAADKIIAFLTKALPAN